MKRISPIALVVLAFVIFATMACMCSSVVPFLDPVEPLVFDPDLLPDAQVGVPYEVTISISQNRTPAGDFSLSEGALPPGLELVYVQAEDTAKITGTPTQAGTFAFTISVWCYGTSVNGQTGDKQYIIGVGE